MSMNQDIAPVYRHRQVAGKMMIFLTLCILFSAALMVLLPESRLYSLVFLILLNLLSAFFTSLHVEVTHTKISTVFGPGPIRRTIPISRVRSATAVRNKWWYGWGIRVIPQGWMFNIAGLDAVELELEDGRKFRIGTDQPERLLDAIRSALPGK